MFRKGLTLAALALCSAAALAFTTSTAKAVDNPFELTLAGSGQNSSRFNGVAAGGDISIGYYLTDNFEVGIRQSVQYSDLGGGVSLTASTRAAIDYNIPLGDHNQWVPYFGANIGYDYGKSVRDTWEAAPEGGVKYFLNSSTFIFGSVEYQFFFQHGGAIGNGFKDGEFIYSLGVGFRI